MKRGICPQIEMERRHFLIGAGVTGLGAAGLIGSGAFSNATAQRDVTVDYESDRDALIGLIPVENDGDGGNRKTSNGDYAQIDNDRLVIEFENLNRDADFTFEDVFVVQNNGTEEVAIDRVNEEGWSYNDDEAAANILVANEKGEWQQDAGRFVWTDGDAAVLEPGEWVSFGIGYWGTEEVGDWHRSEVPDTLTINLGG